MIVPIALAAGLGLAACGGDDKDSDTLSRGDLATKADSICSKAVKEAGKSSTPSNFDDPKTAGPYFDKLASISHKETQDLEALSPAEDAKTDWDAFVTQQKGLDDLIQSLKQNADSKKTSALAEDLQKLPEVGKDVGAAADKIGAKNCAQ